VRVYRLRGPVELTISPHGLRAHVAAAIPDILNIDVVAVFQIFPATAASS
jgi:hypothetical protein